MHAAVFTEGLLTGAGLIIAIGAQNAFVLAQGLRRQHVGKVVAVCVAGDVLLIALGVAGVGRWFAGQPTLFRAVAVFGALFLALYGWRAAKRLFSSESLYEKNPAQSAAQAWATALAVTFLNPHVYLDTVLLLGSLSARFGDGLHVFFAAGAITASILWFNSLGFGASLLAPVLNRPRTWQVIDAGVATLMFWMAFQLARQAWGGFGM